MENKAEHDISVEVEALNESSMRTEGPQDRLVIQRPRTDLGGTIGENSSDGLVNLVYLEFAKLVTKTSSKLREPKTYDEASNNPIHGNIWKETIDEELWTLDSHQTWSYTFLPKRQKVIGYKWVFKVKYQANGSIERFKARLVAQIFFQVHGIDYTETFTPIIRRESLRIFLAIAIMLGMILF